MSLLHIVGIDPGIVHTGVVRLLVDPYNQAITVGHEVIQGIDGKKVAAWVYEEDVLPDIYIEKYVPRAHYGTDEAMVKGEAELMQHLPGAVLLRNFGIKRVVMPNVLELLHLWQFSTSTHHQDLRSAARIAVLGMMKDERTGPVLADIVRSHLDGTPWDVEEL